MIEVVKMDSAENKILRNEVRFSHRSRVHGIWGSRTNHITWEVGAYAVGEDKHDKVSLRRVLGQTVPIGR